MHALRMLRQRVLAVTLLCLLPLCGCAWLAPPEVSGRWEGAATLKMTPDGPEPYEIVFVLAESAGVITGTLRVGAWPTAADVTGSLVGRHVEMTCPLFDILYEGEVHGRTMSGTCTCHEVPDTWEVTRVD